MISIAHVKLSNMSAKPCAFRQNEENFENFQEDFEIF